MQLTDAEIREILLRQKQRKKLQQKRKRRRALFFLLLMLIILAIVILKPAVLISEKNEKQARKTEREASYTGPPRGTVFIDPGHGGMDSGTGDEFGRYEKEDNLKLALQLKTNLEAMGFTVGMSRTEDKQVDRTLRGQMANDAGAQLFISLHRNQADTDGMGVEAFIPKRNDNNSRLLANNILNALAKQGFEKRSIKSGTLNDPNSDYEELAVVTMPATLVEVGFVSSDMDNALFDDNLSNNAKAIANAIDQTFMTLYEPEKAAQAAEEQAYRDKLVKDILYQTMKAISGLIPAHSKETEFPG